MRIFICKSARVIDKDTKMLYMTWFFWQSWKRFMFFPFFKEGVFIFHGSSWLVSVKLSRILLFTHNGLPRSFLKIELKWFFSRIGYLDFRYVHHIGRGSKSLVMNLLFKKNWIKILEKQFCTFFHQQSTEPNETKITPFFELARKSLIVSFCKMWHIYKYVNE